MSWGSGGTVLFAVLKATEGLLPQKAVDDICEVFLDFDFDDFSVVEYDFPQVANWTARMWPQDQD